MKKLIIFFLLSGLTYQSFGQEKKGEVYKIKNSNTFIAAIKSSDFIYYVRTQKKDMWCWAASIQMVLNYQGIKVSQEDIVKAAFQEDINAPANLEEMVKGANDCHLRGNKIIAWIDNDNSPATLINVLANKYPLIVCLLNKGMNIGHALVLTAIYYRYDENNLQEPLKVVLRDPWPTAQSHLEMSWSEFTQRNYGIVHVTY